MIFGIRDVLREVTSDGAGGAGATAPKPKPTVSSTISGFVDMLSGGDDSAPVPAPSAPELPAKPAPEPAANQGAARAAAAGGQAATPAPAVPSRKSAALNVLSEQLGITVDDQGRPVKKTDITIEAGRPGGRRGPPMAQVTRQGTVSPNLGLLADALGEQQQAQANLTRAFQRQEEAKAKALQDTSDLLAAEANRLARQRETAMEDAIDRSRKLQAQADELGAMAPSAGRLFGSDAQAASFGAALSIATGAMLSARTGGPNVALKIIDRAIQRDMESQREAIKNKQFSAQMGLQLAQEMRAAFRDDMVASEAMQATLLRYTENRLQAIISQTNDQVLRARGEEAIANLRMQYAEKIEAATRGSFGVTMAMPLRKAQAMLAASQGQTLPPISTHDMQRDAAQGGGEATQAGLGAASEQKAAEAREDAQLAENAKRDADKKQANANKLTRRGRRRERPQQPTPENPLARYGVEPIKGAPGWGRTPDGKPIPLAAIPKGHARRGTRGLQRIQVPANVWNEPPDGWQKSATGTNEWVRVGGEKLTPLTEQERKQYDQRRDRILTFTSDTEIPGDLNNEDRLTRTKGQQKVKIPWYEGMDQDIQTYNKLQTDMAKWRRTYQGVMNGWGPKVQKQTSKAQRLEAISLFNRVVSQGGTLQQGEVETIGEFLADPAEWTFLDKKGGWQAMDQMFRDSLAVQASRVLNNGAPDQRAYADAMRDSRSLLGTMEKDLTTRRGRRNND